MSAEFHIQGILHFYVSDNVFVLSSMWLVIWRTNSQISLLLLLFQILKIKIIFKSVLHTIFILFFLD
jgi:hypothetical protein